MGTITHCHILGGSSRLTDLGVHVLCGVRTKDGGRGLSGSIASGRLLCKKGDESLVENSTIELPGNLYSLYREYTISEEARNARSLAETSEIG